jgi:hypothetical protein
MRLRYFRVSRRATRKRPADRSPAVVHRAWEALVPQSRPCRGESNPVSCCYVQQRPRMLYLSHFRGEYVLMNKRGRRRMLLVLLLPWQAFGNIRNRSIGPLVSVIRTVGSAGSQAYRIPPEDKIDSL